MTRQLTAIMFADMVGYTAVMQADERQARAHRGRNREALERRVAERSGKILQFYGDGTLSVFQSAIEAVEAAIAIQEDLRSPPPVPIRIGIHTGDIIHDEQGVFGDGVNLAARVQALACPGGVLISEKVYDDVKNQRGIVTRPLGSFALKNVKRPMEIWAVANPGLAVPDPLRMGPRPSHGRTSVAVLPFLNMSSDTENEFFSDGVTEELINALTRINGLQVTARTSSFAFKGQNRDVRAIAEELGVATVLEGSVRRSGDRVRITAQLINAEDGYHLFSKSYDREILDLFQTQDEIAETIAAELRDRFDAEPGVGVAGGSGPITKGAALGVSPSLGESPGPVLAEPVAPPAPEGPGVSGESSATGQIRHGDHFHDAEAYTEFLKGIHKFNQWTPEGARGAIRHFQRAINVDPTCALPHSGMANAYTYLAAMGQMRGDIAYPRAREAAMRGLELEGNAAEAHAAMATVLFFHDWDFQGAYRHFQKALTLTPGSAALRRLYALYLSAIGDHQGAEDELQSALESDPLSSVIRTALAEVYLKEGRHEEARSQLNRVLEFDPEFRAAREMLGWAHLSAGEAGEALREWQEIARRTGDPFKVIPHRIWALAALDRASEGRRLLRLLEEREEREPEVALEVDFALAHLGLGNESVALDYLERAVDRRLGAVVFLNVIPPLAPLRVHPRFKAMVERVGIPGPVGGGKPQP